MQLQDYALGNTKQKINLGYAERGCGVTSLGTRFVPVDAELRLKKVVLAIILKFGIFSQLVFVWIVTALLLKISFKEYAQKTFTYSYDVYGMFWGASVTALGLLVALYGIYAEMAFLFATNTRNGAGQSTLYLMLAAVLTPLVVELPVAIYTARKATVAVPCIFKYPARLMCCGRRRQAECLVTAIVLWVDLVALQLTLLHASVIVLTLSAAPFAIASSVMLLVLALSCLANIFSLFFTIFAHLCTPASQRKFSCSKVIRAVVVLPLLFMIMSYGIIFASIGVVVNMDTKDNNPFSFVNSIATPILLGVTGIFMKKIISAWLKWSPQEGEQETDHDTSRRQDETDELLIP